MARPARRQLYGRHLLFGRIFAELNNPKRALSKMNQGCALAEPGGPWCLNFALGQLENLRFLHTNHMLGTLDFTVSEHWAPFNFP